MEVIGLLIYIDIANICQSILKLAMHIVNTKFQLEDPKILRKTIAHLRLTYI